MIHSHVYICRNLVIDLVPTCSARRDGSSLPRIEGLPPSLDAIHNKQPDAIAPRIDAGEGELDANSSVRRKSPKGLLRVCTRSKDVVPTQHGAELKAMCHGAG